MLLFAPQVHAFALDLAAAVIFHRTSTPDPSDSGAGASTAVDTETESACLRTLLADNSKMIGGNLSVRCYPHRTDEERKAKPGKRGTHYLIYY